MVKYLLHWLMLTDRKCVTINFWAAGFVWPGMNIQYNKLSGWRGENKKLILLTPSVCWIGWSWSKKECGRTVFMPVWSTKRNGTATWRFIMILVVGGEGCPVVISKCITEIYVYILYYFYTWLTTTPGQNFARIRALFFFMLKVSLICHLWPPRPPHPPPH